MAGRAIAAVAAAAAARRARVDGRTAASDSDARIHHAGRNGTMKRDCRAWWPITRSAPARTDHWRNRIRSVAARRKNDAATTARIPAPRYQAAWPPETKYSG